MQAFMTKIVIYVSRVLCGGLSLEGNLLSRGPLARGINNHIIPMVHTKFYGLVNFCEQN